MTEKLIRHLLPEQFVDKIETRLADKSEMLGLLRAKLIEETEELCEAIDTGVKANVLAEAVDVFDVMQAFREHLGYDIFDKLWRAKAQERGTFLRGMVMKLGEPVPMVLICPNCGGQHIDHGVWSSTRIHRTHLCEHCGSMWRPFEYATVGVEKV